MNNRKLWSALVLTSALGLSLTACGGSSETAPPPTSPTVESLAPSTPTPTSSEPARSARGNIIKKFGQPAGRFNPENNKQLVNFTINSAAIDPPCTGPAPQPAENGHFVILDAIIETLPELAEAQIPQFDLSPHNFKFVGANGTTYNGSLTSGASYGCLPDNEILPINGVGPAEKVTGKIVLDVPETTGTLVFKPMGGSGSGWEWAL